MSDRFYKTSEDGSVLMFKDMDEESNYVIYIMFDIEGVGVKTCLGYEDDEKKRDTMFDDDAKLELVADTFLVSIQGMIDEADE